MVKMMLEEKGYVPTQDDWLASVNSWSALADYESVRRITVMGYR